MCIRAMHYFRVYMLCIIVCIPTYACTCSRVLVLQCFVTVVSLNREHQDVRIQSHVRTAPGRDVATRTGYAAPVRMVPSAHMSIKSGLARHATLRIGQDCCIRSFAWLRSDVPRGFVCSIQRLHHTVRDAERERLT